MDILHYIKYIFSSDYRYDFKKEMSEKKLRRRMAEHPENFSEDEYYVNEKIKNDKCEIVMYTSRLKDAYPPSVLERVNKFHSFLEESDDF